MGCVQVAAVMETRSAHYEEMDEVAGFLLVDVIKDVFTEAPSKWKDASNVGMVRKFS